MRIAAVFLLLAFVVAHLERQPARPVNATVVATEKSQWVRTADGWERPTSWGQQCPAPPSLNPLVVAAGQVLGSILALVAFSGEKKAGFRRLGAGTAVRCAD